MFAAFIGSQNVALAVSGGPQPGPPWTPVGRHPPSSQPQLCVLLCHRKPVTVTGGMGQSGVVGVSPRTNVRRKSVAKERVSGRGMRILKPNPTATMYYVLRYVGIS